jgi:hypothetical protein
MDYAFGDSLFTNPPMKTRSPSRGRRRAVEKFTARQGIWMLGIVILISIGLVLLYVFGYLHFDAD